MLDKIKVDMGFGYNKTTRYKKLLYIFFENKMQNSAMAKRKTKKPSKRLSKKELLRRKKISQSLKSYHKLKKEFEKEFNQALDQRIQVTETKKFRFSKVKKNVLQYIKKDKSKAIVANVLNINYKKPLELSMNNIDTITDDLTLLKNPITNFIKENKDAGKKLLNVGYKIDLTFYDKDGKNPRNVKNTSYTPMRIATKKEVINDLYDDLVKNIQDRFDRYVQLTDDVKILGFEAEVEQ